MRLQLIVLVSLALRSDGAKILGVLPTPSYSHQIAFRPLWAELSRRGHQITLCTTDPMNDTSLPNLKEISWHYAYDIYKARFPTVVQQENVLGLYMGAQMVRDIVDGELQHPRVQQMIKDSDERFDLVMIEYYYPAMFAFKKRFNCPFVGLASFDAAIAGHEALGNPVNPALYPDHVSPFSRPKDIYQRLYSAGYYFLIRLCDYLVLNSLQEDVVRRHFGSGYPPVSDLYRSVDMLFANTNPIFHNVRPTLPNVIQFGGSRKLQPQKPLEKELQEYVDDAEGFIYFSLGTNVNSNFISNSTKRIVLDTLAKLPYKVLLKFESNLLEDVPHNVKIMTWFPQQDILRQENIKLFITQGGLQSIEEAVYSNVPMLGMPFFGDQFGNVDKMVSLGYGVSVSHNSLTVDIFIAAIKEAIDNPKYRKRIKEISELVTDQPMNGLEKILWWTEYLLRHKDIRHMKSTAWELPFYQYYLLDIIGFCCCIILLSYLTIKITIRYIMKKLKRADKQKVA